MIVIFLLAFATLIGMGASGLLVLRGRRQLEERTARITMVMGPHRESWVEPVATTGISRTSEVRSFRSVTFAVLRHDPRRRMYYPLGLRALGAIALIVGVVFCFAGGRFIGPPGYLAGPLAGIWFIRAFHGWAEERTQSALYLQFPEALASVVRSVRVGLPVVEAVRVVARESVQPTASEFTYLVEQTNIGVPLEEALRDMAARNGLPEYRFFATALSLQSQTGGGLTETLENLAETIRKRVAIRMKGHALAAEARMSSYILGALPIVTGGLLMLSNPGYIMPLFTDPTGRKLLFAGIGLLGMGAATMRVMIRRSLT